MDIFGQALLDFYNDNYSEDLITTSNITEADEMSLPYLFRSYAEMPELEKTALQNIKGKILDVGCGSGSHSLYVQNKNHSVTAIDTSKGAIAVAKKRGVIDARNSDLLELTDETYDTILLLMNGTGIFETLAKTPVYLQHLKTLLTENGQILIDSSDLRFMYDTNEDGSIWVPADRYYGELDFRLHYKGNVSEPFQWLYIDAPLFEKIANENGFVFQILAEGSHYDYLARLSVKPIKGK